MLIRPPGPLKLPDAYPVAAAAVSADRLPLRTTRSPLPTSTDPPAATFRPAVMTRAVRFAADVLTPRTSEPAGPTVIVPLVRVSTAVPPLALK